MQLSRPRSAPQVTGILDDLRRIVRVLRESSRAAERDLGVTGAQLFVLKALSGTRALSLKEVGERTRTHQSTVSVVVKRLVDGRLVKSRTSAIDARRVELELTAAGRALLERAPLAAQDRLLEGLEKLPLKVREALDGYVKVRFQAEDLERADVSALLDRLDSVGLPTYAVLRPMTR